MDSHVHGPGCSHHHTHADQKQPETQQQQQQQPKTQSRVPEPTIVVNLFHLEGILKLIFFPSIFLLPGKANHIAAFICILGIFRQCKLPSLTKEWGRKFLTNDFTHNLFYMVPFLFFGGAYSFVYYIPLGIHFWIGLAQYIYLKHPKIYQRMSKYIDFTRQNDKFLKLQKAKFEFYELGIILFYGLLGQGSLMLFLIYGNFLRVKYILSDTTKQAATDINVWIEQKFNKPDSPTVIKKIIQVLRRFCAYLVKK